MFDWLGFKKGLPLYRSWRMNRELKTDIEQIFEGIADTRKELLADWANEYWGHMERLADLVAAELPSANDGRNGAPGAESVAVLLEKAYDRADDFTELFLLDAKHTVTFSTFAGHVGASYGDGTLLHPGIEYCRKAGSGSRYAKCLFGPYGDPVTLALGPRTSSFHDKMTILFMHPLTVQGQYAGMLCGRVPNDVLGDLIQRESGHVYPDSGDNYLFMAKPSLLTHIAPGTALSRSRFEDRTFTHGENLKDGVTTDWGIVSVKEHTELEIIFTDPATGQLHPGVANTIKNGSNLFVEFPGYSDYRHIPVIGKGVTFQLPHCPDVWGMMCEGDLEEVYRVRSIGRRMSRIQLWSSAVVAVLVAGLSYALGGVASPGITAAAVGVFAFMSAALLTGGLQRKESRRVVDKLHSLNRFIRINAEGKGDLTQRIPLSSFDNDETKELAKWINNMIDSLECIMLKVKAAAEDVMASQLSLGQSAGDTARTTEEVHATISSMIGGILTQLQDIDTAKDAAADMRKTLREMERQAEEQITVAQTEVERIGDKMEHISQRVEETNGTIRSFVSTVEDIRGVMQVIEEISAQTHLLALNASIEAARVGEQGRGFAVVASEIRKLSEMTRKQAEEVQQITLHIYEGAKQAFSSMETGTRVVEEGTELVHAARRTLQAAGADRLRKTQVVDGMVDLMERIAEVSMSNRQASAGVESNMQQLAAAMENVRHTSHNVGTITGLLQQMVGQFKLTESRLR
ncbi:methyl-accepting chemotaxis protein [Paenibacillus thailandensis]|uniref:Methyl-accepting chemotaxis protein n=1 Tax=Paenibacillus thailandensis TaxID=393250 RepID=A0ABW5R4F9_9BACL